jgi:hypothetical protein
MPKMFKSAKCRVIRREFQGSGISTENCENSRRPTITGTANITLVENAMHNRIRVSKL